MAAAATTAATRALSARTAQGTQDEMEGTTTRNDRNSTTRAMAGAAGTSEHKMAGARPQGARPPPPPPPAPPARAARHWTHLELAKSSCFSSPPSSSPPLAAAPATEQACAYGAAAAAFGPVAAAPRSCVYSSTFLFDWLLYHVLSLRLLPCSACAPCPLAGRMRWLYVAYLLIIIRVAIFSFFLCFVFVIFILFAALFLFGRVLAASAPCLMSHACSAFVQSKSLLPSSRSSFVFFCFSSSC